MKGTTYFARWGFSINEGAGPINFHMQWRDMLAVYVYAFGRRWYWQHIWKNKDSAEQSPAA